MYIVSTYTQNLGPPGSVRAPGKEDDWGAQFSRRKHVKRISFFLYSSCLCFCYKCSNLSIYLLTKRVSGNVLLFILLNLHCRGTFNSKLSSTCTKGPDLQMPSIEAKQDGTLRPNQPLAASPLPASTVLTYTKVLTRSIMGAGRLCK